MMGASRLAAALTDFGAPGKALIDTGPIADGPIEAAAPPVEEGPDIEALIGEAVAEAEAALREKLEADHAEALAAERQRHQEEADALNARIGEEIGARVSSAVAEMEERIVALTTSVTARILTGSLLTEELRERAITSLAATIRDAVRDDEALRVNVSGPASLYEPLRAALAEDGGRVSFVESGGLDLTVTLDESVYETRIGEWSAAMAEILN